MLYDVKQSQNYNRHFTVCANNDSELIKIELSISRKIGGKRC